MSLPAPCKPRPTTESAAGDELSLSRLYLLRAGYLVMALGLALTRWPLLIGHDASWPLMDGVVVCMLVAQSLLFFLGVRYPVKMIPILLFEMTWKVIWLSTVALPLGLAGGLNGATFSVAVNCSLVAIVLLIVPWPFLARQYVTSRGDRWHAAAKLTAGADPRGATG
ncbi:hypothetical protein J2T22_004219 [Pseudarthrobacter defluvii]|uniref:Uncharacterized protein n=1 Tax=Pseudarthrobacter defluvii TaxID=410837 RepID=A0ABT9UMX6_9MICC|nr:hypothetical protein [Pseudarthrobacter defluvii]MDQ0121006.1 hypothetical protein [Pseudarthrobacter defluvii]